jgi:hypothetical protein
LTKLQQKVAANAEPADLQKELDLLLGKLFKADYSETDTEPQV